MNGYVGDETAEYEKEAQRQIDGMIGNVGRRQGLLDAKGTDGDVG